MKVFITGASGFIGTHLTKKLLKEGHAMTDVFRYFGISARYLLTLQLAEQRGEFERALGHVAAQMERQTKNNHMMIKLLTYPITLFFLLVCLLIGFRQFFLPVLFQNGGSRSGLVW